MAVEVVLKKFKQKMEHPAEFIQHFSFLLFELFAENKEPQQGDFRKIETILIIWSQLIDEIFESESINFQKWNSKTFLKRYKTFLLLFKQYEVMELKNENSVTQQRINPNRIKEVFKNNNHIREEAGKKNVLDEKLKELLSDVDYEIYLSYYKLGMVIFSVLMSFYVTNKIKKNKREDEKIIKKYVKKYKIDSESVLRINSALMEVERVHNVEFEIHSHYFPRGQHLNGLDCYILTSEVLNNRNAYFLIIDDDLGILDIGGNHVDLSIASKVLLEYLIKKIDLPIEYYILYNVLVNKCIETESQANDQMRIVNNLIANLHMETKNILSKCLLHIEGQGYRMTFNKDVMYWLAEEVEFTPPIEDIVKSTPSHETQQQSKLALTFKGINVKIKEFLKTDWLKKGQYFKIAFLNLFKGRRKSYSLDLSKFQHEIFYIIQIIVEENQSWFLAEPEGKPDLDDLRVGKRRFIQKLDIIKCIEPEWWNCFFSTLAKVPVALKAPAFDQSEDAWVERLKDFCVFKVERLGLTISSIIGEVMGPDCKTSKEHLEMIAEKYAQQYQIPSTIIPLMVPLIIEYLGFLSNINIKKSKKMNASKIDWTGNRYIIYSHNFPKGDKLSEEEYHEFRGIHENEFREYLFMFDDTNNEFYLKGIHQKDVNPDSKELLKLLIKNAGHGVTYQEVYENRYRVQIEATDDFLFFKIKKWIDDLGLLFENQKGLFLEKNAENSIILKLPADSKYCLIEDLIAFSAFDIREEKKEYKLYSNESQEGEEIKALFDKINAFQQDDLDFKYRMYTEQDVRENIGDTLKGGKKLADKWHSTLQDFYPRLANEFLYILDFASEIFYYNKQKLETSDDPKAEYNYYKALFIILLSPKGTRITFEDLYLMVTDFYDKKYKKKARITTQHWFTVLKHRLGVKKKDLNRLFKSWKKYGYEVVKEDEPKFFVLLEKSMVQNIMKFFKS